MRTQEDTALGADVRAPVYGLLAALLVAPPNQALLDQLSYIDVSDEDNELACAWQILRAAGLRADLVTLDAEYHELFVGVGRGELVPYGSWYQTGFLMDRPLARLRGDLSELGFERQDGVSEPEDHVGALFEVMGFLASPDGLEVGHQRRFFQAHLEPWIGIFCRDLQQARAATFYRAVGQFAEKFIDFETKFLTLIH